MRAVVITRPGGPEVLEIAERAVPEPAEGEVRVEVRAAGLNRADLLQRMGRYPSPAGAPADIPGLEFAGEVDTPGAGVTGWRGGERVFGIAAGGAQAEFICVPASTLARIPDTLDWVDAAAVPEAFITAHDAMVSQGGLGRGERVVVHAVGSGVGLAAAQLADALGALVFGTTRTAEKLARARVAGVEAGLVLADGPEPLAAAVAEWSGGVGADMVLDLVGGDYVPAGLAALGTRGRLILVGLVAGRRADVDLGMILSRRLSIRGTVLRTRPVAEKAAATAAFAADVIPLLASGRLRPIVDRAYPLDEIGAAHTLLESNGTFGKVVVTM